MSFLAHDHPDYLAVYGDAIDRFCEPPVNACPVCNMLTVTAEDDFPTVCEGCEA